MDLDKITQHDLGQIKELQPEGWHDITKEFQFYINSNFCYPIKATIGNLMVGIGNSIVFNNTAWLAHIIVRNEYRNKGIGSQIVGSLLASLKRKKVVSVSLIATELGEPVYIKHGFRTISEYVFLKKEQLWKGHAGPNNIIAFQEKFLQQLLRLDKKISGEDREKLIDGKLDNCQIYVENDELLGYHLPSVGEGPIYATAPNAGIELMKYKYCNTEKAVLPAENKLGLEFLISNGFSITTHKGKRMVLGKAVDWKPEYFFSRVGGNYG